MSRWRARCRSVIDSIYSSRLDLRADPVAMLKAMSKAYPFGSRTGHPYKMWLKEMAIARSKLRGRLDTPGVDEIEVCNVARDLVEDDKLEEANELLKQAPNRLGRQCPACGQPRGEPCEEPDLDTAQYQKWKPMLVPHAARLVGDSGPLFADVPGPQFGPYP